jgi:fructoselysine-6-P-deglycase FrlB-like protein
VLPAQLIAERLARLRGRDPDRPSGLRKVTETF